MKESKEDGKQAHTEKREQRGQESGLAARTRAYSDVYSSTRDHRAATRAYCAGNRWLTENAKGVGNW